MTNQTRTPFVLSGGGARGFAHLGVLKALEERNIYPTEIAATSAGALVGAFIADGFKAEEIKELVLKHIHFGYLIEWTGWRSKMITLNKIGEFIRKNLRHKRIEDLEMPFYPTAVNFLDGSTRIFTSGDIVEAILAASSIPAIFSPFVIDDIPYVDGGLIDNLPIGSFEDCRPEIIAVHVNPLAPFDAKSNAARTIDRAFNLTVRRQVQSVADCCRLFIEPLDLHHYGLFDVHKLPEIYKVGYQYTTKLLSSQ